MPEDNRWYIFTGYKPEEASFRTGPPVSLPSGPPGPPNPPGPPRRGRGERASWRGLGRQIVVGTAKAALVAALIWIGTAAYARFFPSGGPPVSYQVPNLSAYGVVEIERLPAPEAALQTTKRDSPEFLDVTRDWQENGLIRIGAPNRSPAFYAARRRVGHDAAYGRLMRNGIGRPSLYEVSVPSDWTDRELKVQLAFWATQCGVSPAQIHVWSSFRPTAGGPLVDECRVGGICLIVALKCGDAFLDLESR